MYPVKSEIQRNTDGNPVQGITAAVFCRISLLNLGGDGEVEIIMKVKKTRLFASIIIAILASLSVGATAMAQNEVSERDALTQGAVLYEKMTGNEISYPEELVENEGYDESYVKAAALGLAGLDEYESITYENYIRRQDFAQILYKAIISYNPDYTITAEEAEQILNDCYDNAYLDDENRIAYAFLVKQGFIENKVSSEPNGELTWDECAKWVDKAYNYFVSSDAVTVNGCEIKIGENISTVTDVLGMPNRIDDSDYSFKWYVYDGDYDNFVMIGVEGDRICAFFTNSKSFTYNGVASGSDYAQLVGENNEKSGNITVFTTPDNKIDGVLCNGAARKISYDSGVKPARSSELIDIINANRAKNGKSTYTENDILNSEAYLASIGSSSGTEGENVSSEKAGDIFEIYSGLLSENAQILSNNDILAHAIGVSVSVDDNSEVSASFVTDNTVAAGIDTKSLVTVEDKKEDIEPVAEVTTPVIVSPSVEDTFDGTGDVVVELALRAAEQYRIEVFDYENDEYAVNKYITTNDTKFILPKELFTAGRDYRIIVSSIAGDGTALPSEEVLFSYGSQYENGVKIITPYTEAGTDDDYIAVKWESDIYSDFYVDLYNQDGELIVSEIVEDEYNTLIKGVDPGKYYLYVTALRKGTKIEKAQDMAEFTVTQPEPVINEIILEHDDVYDFVYEDEDLGVLYFYDEDIVEVEDENGETVKKKKIIQKQVKNTKAYRQLASKMSKPVSTTGDPVISIVQSVRFGTEGSSELGNAIVAEAEKYLGVPYVWGGTSPTGFDCSGLVQYVCNTLGIDVSRVAEDQFTDGVAVSRDQLQPGDLIFFENNGYIHHVGIYVGNNTMIHAPHTGDVVRYQSLDNAYYQTEYAGARRVY